MTPAGDPRVRALADAYGVPLEDLVRMLQPRTASLTVSVEDDTDPDRSSETLHIPSLGQDGAITTTTTVTTDASRYERLGLLGTGGMGEVHRVRDRVLGRVLAMKTLAPGLHARPEQVARFLAEAQLTAQLEHPGIVPVHDMGRLADGRVWFTMKEVRGRSLGQVIAEVHHGARGTGWTLRRLVDAYLRVCEALAYAHARGVIHRDLKPANVLVGEHGEVLVVDWGLAALVDGAVRDPEPVRTDRDGVDAFATRVGTVAGTPAYMAPEQARGETTRIGPRSDVYALGSILYQILSGQAPYEGASAVDVLRAVVEGPPVPVAERRGASSVPPELAALCERAMAREPEDRFADAASVAGAVAAWLDGARREDQARRIAARAAEQVPLAADLRARARALQIEGAALLARTRAWQPDDVKAPGWERQDAAAELERRANLVEVEEESLLRAALAEAPDLPEAHAALAARYRTLHAAAEAAQRDTTRLEVLLRQHVHALPAGSPERRAHEHYLSGAGAFQLDTDPPGAEVLLYRHERFRRRLVPRFVQSLGVTPLRDVTLPMGSYLCVLRLDGHADVHYPIHLTRNGRWDGVPPSGSETLPIRLPRAGMLGPDDCYVPAGWFLAGDAEVGGISPVRRAWCDAWIVRRFPVTNAEYIAFLDDLVAQGRAEEALRHAPRERAGTIGELGALIHAFDGVRFHLRPDADGDVWRADWPVIMVDWRGAVAYAAWEAARTNQPWQLLPELVWEKASRGVDGRVYPWGDTFDPSWTRMRESARRRSLPASVRSYPVDQSVYGVRGMAGNVRDWCADLWQVSGARVVDDRVACSFDAEARGTRVTRGGGWGNTAMFIRSAQRSEFVEGTRLDYVGFRLGRPA